jgi:membrane protein
VSVTERLDRFQQTHRWAGFPLAVVYKFADEQGGYLAALLVYYAFLSLFPLLLLLVTILGFVLQGDVHAQSVVVSSAVSQIPVIGDTLRTNVHAVHGSVTALVAGVAASVYGATGVAQAGQYAMNTIWAVPRHRRANPLRSRFTSLVSVTVLGAGALATTAITGLFGVSGAFGHDLGMLGRLLALVVSLLGNSVLFAVGFRLLTPSHIPRRHLAPGAVAAAVCWQVLQGLGGYYVSHSLRHASQLYGLFGIVLGLIGYLYLAAVTTLLCAEANAVRARRLWPRSLLTPFTDDVTLTRADERQYSDLATAQQAKGFEEIDVTFNPDAKDEKAAAGPPGPS